MTLAYRVIPRLSLGIEWNPRADDVSPLVNLVAASETAKTPALMFGTSSDRIGTPEGQAYYFTVSKDLSTVNGWPISPYVGASYGTFENDLRAIGGMYVRFPRRFGSTLIYDGKNTHLAAEYNFLQRHTVSVLWVDLEEPGVAYAVAW